MFDPFGHNVTTRHFMNAAKREMAQSKDTHSKKVWGALADCYRENIELAEKQEADYRNN